VFVIASDHGGTPSQFQVVDVRKVLEETGFVVYREGPKGEREIDWTRTRAVDIGLVHQPTRARA